MSDLRTEATCSRPSYPKFSASRGWPVWLEWRHIQNILDLELSKATHEELGMRYDLLVRRISTWSENRQKFVSGWIYEGGSHGRFHDSPLRPPPKRPANVHSKPDTPVEEIFRNLNAFPRKPTGYKEQSFVDKTWFRALTSVTERTQGGLEVFRDYFDAKYNTVTPPTMPQARQFYKALTDLQLIDFVEVQHRPGKGRSKLVPTAIRELLSGSAFSESEKGSAIFYLKSRATEGRGYGLRYVLTLLTIADCGFIEEVRAHGSVLLKYSPPPAPQSEYTLNRHALYLMHSPD